jgi:uncharacterized protein (TIGR00645 family)
MDDPTLVQREHPSLERMIAQAIFTSRWLLAPFYIGLVVSLIVLLLKFIQKTAKLISDAVPASSSEIITAVLSLVDVSLVASLVLMVILAGYENFVSGFDLKSQKYKPSFLGHVDFGDLKLKLLTSIVAIAAIHVLESFMKIPAVDDHELIWSVAILIAFVVCALLLAVMNRILPDRH